MRRRGVPCGCTDNGGSSGCCGLKEKLAVLWDRTIGSILRINGISPDGDGDFTIEAGSNITLTETGTGNGIRIDSTATVNADWDDITNKPNTIAGYDITDAYTKTETDNLLNNKVGTSGDQDINGNLNLLRDLVIPDITASTLIRSYSVSGKDSDNEYFSLGAMQIRRYANRTRWRVYITRYMDNPVAGTSLIFDVFDSGRVYLFIENIVNGTTTNHTIIDSTP